MSFVPLPETEAGAVAAAVAAVPASLLFGGGRGRRACAHVHIRVMCIEGNTMDAAVEGREGNDLFYEKKKKEKRAKTKPSNTPFSTFRCREFFSLQTQPHKRGSHDGWNERGGGEDASSSPAPVGKKEEKKWGVDSS